MRGVRVFAGSDAVRTASVPGESDWDYVHAIVTAKAQAVAKGMTPAAVFSHATAAHLHGMPLPPRLALSTTLHVSVARQEDRPRIDGIDSHLSPRDVRTVARVGDLRVTPPVSTWVALASVLTVRELIVVGDHLVRRRAPDATVADLRRAVERSAGRHGIKRLRAAVELVRPRTDSPKETELRMILLDHGLPEPVVNHPIRDQWDRLIRHGDLAYPDHRVLIEYDGEIHRLDEAQYRLDKEQLDRILAEGWVVIHVLKQHLTHPRGIAARVRRALQARAHRPFV
ncbi:hypothetical protein [Microbacterium sulfonylureivorans]|uniref:hypothetical protein n=1 Tax=Microbacterium sulfonylureivorans TaxID=2486854 RepID=UPI000FDCC3F5|nr:hypothetical protein [Microbacterium sulfonylureivorans]